MRVSDKIKEQVQSLPDLPGVYMMKDAAGEIIYVGKAKNLKNRVRSYFRGFDKHDLKTQTLVLAIDDFDYIIANTEAEALVLEANFIKRYQPRFNILLKDDKFYPYIVVTDDDFPRVLMTRNTAMYPNAKVYGPYTSADDARKVVEFLNTKYLLRASKKQIDAPELDDSGKEIVSKVKRYHRACLNYYIGRCSAPCVHNISAKEYSENVRLAQNTLAGSKVKEIGALKKEMEDVAQELRFERAAELRDLASALENLKVKQRVLQHDGKNQDYIAAEILGEKACGMLFQYRDGKLIGREVYAIKGAEGFSQEDVLEAFLKQYYTGAENIPPEIYISREIEGIEDYEAWFRKLLGAKVVITVPKIGEKKRLIELVEKNAQEYVQKFQKRIDKEEHNAKIAESQLRELLGVGENLPLNRIEAFDISNTSGVHSVASMVVFEKAKKKRSDYRRYRIKTVDGIDDYASMQEVVYRRYRKKPEGLSMPDLILIDGGKGHTAAAEKVLNALDVHIPVAGMVKDDFHKTEDLVYGGERLGLKNYKTAFKLVYAIQEEVHRFAIEYHKSLRSKEMIKSELDFIKGVGEKRKIALLKHFKSTEAISKASVEELLACETISRPVAEAVYEYFKNK